MNYLKKQNKKATESEVKEYVSKLREDPDGQKLTRAEIMQFINIRPTQVNFLIDLIQYFIIDKKFVSNFCRMSKRMESGT